MELLENKRKQLSEIYYKHRCELQNICPYLVEEGYSHPYYLYIPDEWYERGYRILIVGEEGHGVKSPDISIEEAQTFNKEYMESQLGISTAYPRNASGFWNRIRKIHALFDTEDVSITWTNIDKIHRSGRGNCRLNDEERTDLHRVPTAVLAEEIELLNPTHVIYFGWYGISLKAELPKVFEMLYPSGLGDFSVWKESKIATIVHENVKHLFTYHPAWGQRQKGYEQRVLNTIKLSLKECTET